MKWNLTPSDAKNAGNSIAVRIPSSYVKELKITPGKSAVLMKERNGLRIIA